MLYLLLFALYTCCTLLFTLYIHSYTRSTWIASSAGCEWIEDKLTRASANDKLAQSLGVIIDIEILALADAFVGTFTSALNRVAFQLRCASMRSLFDILYVNRSLFDTHYE